MDAIPHFGMDRNTRLTPLRDIDTNVENLLDKVLAPPRTEQVKGSDLLTVKNLRKTFATKKQDWKLLNKSQLTVAVDNVSFNVRRGECLGLVGESGCGKTTLSKILMRAVSPDSGSIHFNDDGKKIDVLAAQDEELLELRTKIQMVFQDPISSLSPRMTISNILREPFEIHKRGDRTQRDTAVAALLHAVGMGTNAMQRYPHSFSGGQRQRIGISRALAVAPSLIICDEPVSALDVSVQAQILNLLKDLQKKMGLTYLFISHNLAVVDYVADRVAVMWAGKIVEMAPRSIIMNNPVHPYTKALLSAVPFPDLDQPLDLEAAGKTSSTSSQDWPEIFQEEGPGSLSPIHLGEDHFVLARSTSDARDLIS